MLPLYSKTWVTHIAVSFVKYVECHQEAVGIMKGSDDLDYGPSSATYLGI